MNPIPCTVCGEDGHHLSKCPSLVAPLQPGFPKISGPPPGSGDDEDDERLTWRKRFYRLIPLKNSPPPSCQTTP